MLNYYVDPGSGFIFAQNTSFLWAVILGLIAPLFFVFRFLINFFKKKFWIIIFFLIIIVTGAILMHNHKNTNKVVILGIDAMEPNITERLMSEGKLPNLSYLKSHGAYSHLATTIPAESVVAWTGFSTGVNPGNHGIFGFVMRDPRYYLPFLSLNDISNVNGKIEVQTRRKAKTFWSILSENGIPSDIYFCPNTFPPERILGRMLSGMGTPDITGTMGKFSFYTSKTLSQEDKESRGRIISVGLKDNIIETKIFGPKVAGSGSVSEAVIPLKVVFSQDSQSVSLEFQGKQVLLKQGNWSDWQKISFKIDFLNKTHGIFRFYLKSAAPDFELYLSPINFDPQAPVFPVSYPESFSQELAKSVGLYYTQGMPHDTWALSEGRLDEKAFLEHVDEILEEKTKILNKGLKEHKNGLLFFYFDTLDIVQHMFWRYIDPANPLYEKDLLYQETIFAYYEKIDRIIGEAAKNLDKDTTLIILSDHGFNSFRRSVHLNRWLLENGLLVLKNGVEESKEFFDGIDWLKTKAYAVGFGGIYINLKGRERNGIVDDSEAGQIKNTISEGLKQWRDTQAGTNVVKNVYFKENVFFGAHAEYAPDLFVGFNAGYRASWQTALGGVPKVLIEDNKKKWSGEHLIDSSLVPGVLFINRKTSLKQPFIIDVAPTVLSLFGIDISKGMDGKVLIDNVNEK